MSNKTEFRNIWERTIAQIKVDIDHNSKIGKINPEIIKSNYIMNAKKWETNVYYEGEWLENIGNDTFSAEFVRELNDIEFKTDIPEPTNSYIGFIISAVGIAAIFVLPLAFSISWVISVIVGLAVAISGPYLQGALTKRNTAKYNKEVKEDFIKIVVDKGKKLEDLFEQEGVESYD